MPYSLKCPACRKKFPWDPKEGFPENCPLCKTRVAHDRADDDIVIPFIRSNGHTKATDDVYRKMEAGSEVRAQAAADIAGVPVAEMSDLKITDLRPTTRQGDIAAPPLPPHLRDIGSFGGDARRGLSTGAEYSMSVQSGPHPNAGAHTRTLLQSAHPSMISKHAIGLSMDTGRPVTPSTDVVSDRPANETLQPGYRIRG